MLKKTITLGLVLTVTGCGTLWKTTLPTQTALDQMLVSTAADRAANLLVLDSQGQVVTKLGASLGKTFIDAKNFNSADAKNLVSIDTKNFSQENQQYALHAIRRNFADAGVALVDDPKEADTIVEVASGALSVDNTYSLVGIPAMALPIPLAGNVSIPEIPLYKKETNRGLAKFAVSLRDAHTGKTRGKSFFTVGTAKVDSWEVLLFFKFVDNDMELPKQYQSIGD